MWRSWSTWLKANPGKATVGTVGVGSAAHLCVVDFQNKTGTSIATRAVSGRRAGPAGRGGRADRPCMPGNVADAGALSRRQNQGLRRCGEKRWFAAPDVPTIEEAGVPGFHITFWHGLWAPKGTPKPIIAKLNAAVVEAFADPAIQKRFTEIGHALPARNEQTPEACSPITRPNSTNGRPSSRRRASSRTDQKTRATNIKID